MQAIHLRWQRVRAESHQRLVLLNELRQKRWSFLPRPAQYIVHKIIHARLLLRDFFSRRPETVEKYLLRERQGNREDPVGDSLRKIRLDLLLANPQQRIRFPVPDNPVVSIVVLNYNRDEQLLDCLSSILAHTQDISYELIVADNASTDRAPDLLDRLDGAKVLFNEQNLGFVRGNNQAAIHARGRYLMLLNNDTLVGHGWLSTLVRTLETWPDCGAVGPKLIYPDGRLQESGAIVYSDGRLDQLGFGGNALEDCFGHAREVDYCSGACLLLRTDLFHQMGGFDDLFAPAYYEDVDLCFGLKARGLKVVYQPASVVVHHGPSVRSFSRTQAMCERNQARFVEKRRKLLEQQTLGGHPADLVAEGDRRPGQRLLVIDRSDSDVPIQRARQGAVVTFIPLGIGLIDSHRWFAWQQEGIEILRGDMDRLQETVRTRVGCYDEIMLGSGVDSPEIRALLAFWLPLTEINPLRQELRAAA